MADLSVHTNKSKLLLPWTLRPDLRRDRSIPGQEVDQELGNLPVSKDPRQRNREIPACCGDARRLSLAEALSVFPRFCFGHKERGA
jgi:hypothetical protein